MYSFFIDELAKLETKLRPALVKIALTTAEADALARKAGNLRRLKSAAKWGAIGVGGAAALGAGGYAVRKYLKKKQEDQAQLEGYPEGF